MTRKGQSGQILVVVFVALGVALFTVLSVVAGAQIYFQNAAYSMDAEKATALAEAGVDKALASLNKTGGSYLGEAETTLDDGSYSVTITSKDAATKVVEATGYIPNRASAKAKRSIKITASRGVGASFVYGVQVGEGGMTLGNSNIITGTIYSNGSVNTVGGGNRNEITGDIWVAGGPQATADKQTDCAGSNCIDFIFGTQVSGQSQLDISQSFQPSVSNVLNKVSLKVKKIGNPSDATVRIMADKSSQPDKNHVLATGTLFANLISTSYAFIDVTFDTLPDLAAGTTYWIMIDTSINPSNYWAWQNDLAKSYTCGNPDVCLGMWSPDWSSGNPSWSAISPGGDLSFKTFMGGAPTAVDGGPGKDILVKKDAQGNGGNVHANTIKNIDMQAGAYYQTIENSTAASLHPNSSDPPPKVFPISDANVLDWENQAAGCDSSGNNCQKVQVGDITSCVNVLESKKYVGNITFNSHCIVTIKTPIWITGTLNFNTNNTLTLSSEYNSTSGVIVVDGQVTLGSNNLLQGTGIGSSLLMVLSNYDSRSNGISAIIITNTGNSGVFYASKGIIEPGNRNTFKELTGWGIKLINNGILNYETGLSSTLFQSGPAGTYSLVKGTYQVK